MAGSKPTAEHIARNSKNPDHVSTVLPPTNIPANRNPVQRLSFSGIDGLGWDYDSYAATVDRSCLPGHTFFLDTCFLTTEEIPNRFWQSIRNFKVCIVPLIGLELEPWMQNPWKNQAICQEVIRAKQTPVDGISFLPALDLSNDVDRGASHYIRLLALRKQAYNIAQRSLAVKLERSPTESELQPFVQKHVSDRGMRLARKGLNDVTKVNFLADESLIVRGFLYALLNGCDVTILTRDSDLLEQHYKFQYLLDTHYRSLLLSRAFEAQPLNFFECSLSDGGANQAFESCRLLRMPAGMDQRVLPSKHKFANVHVDYVGIENGVSVSSSYRYSADQQMLEVFRIRGKTNGLNTDRPDGKNFHRCVMPSDGTGWGHFCGLTVDRFITQDDCRWSIVDVQLAMTRCERSSSYRTLGTDDDETSVHDTRLGFEISKIEMARLVATYSKEFININPRALQAALKLQPPWTRLRASPGILAYMDEQLLETVREFIGDRTQDGTVKSLASIVLPNDSSIKRTFEYYTTLLAHRKLFGRVCELELMKKGISHPSHNQIKRKVEEYIGIKSWSRIDSFLADSSRDVFDDDRLVVDALMSAVYCGQDTIVLTDNKSLVEQFWAMTQMLESHYRAWCIANTMHHEFGRLKTNDGSLEKVFKGMSYICKVGTANVLASMPTDSVQARVQVWLIDGDADRTFKIFTVGFCVEPAMREMFQCKAENEFRSTDKLDGRNLHFQWSASERFERFGTCFLGEDVPVMIGSDSYPHDDRLQVQIESLPAFDLMHMTRIDRQFPFPWSEQAARAHFKSSRKSLMARKRKR